MYCRWRGLHGDDVHATADKFSREYRQPIDFDEARVAVVKPKKKAGRARAWQGDVGHQGSHDRRCR